MKRMARLAVSAAALSLAFGMAPVLAQTAPKFAIDATWPKDLPKDWITGQLGGVCTGEQDHIYVVNRRDITDEEKETSTSAPSIIKFDTEGNVVGSWGDQTTVPGSIHGCFVDADKNIYVAGNGDAIVQKYAPDGKLLLQIGTRGKFDSVDGTRRGAGQQFGEGPAPHAVRHRGRSGQRRHLHLRRLRQPPRGGVRQDRQIPAPMGASGDRARKRKRHVPGVFAQVVHCIAMSNAGLIYVCDRQGNRVQVFQKDGTFVRNILIPNKSGKLPDKRGTAWWVAFSPDREQKFLYMMNGGTEEVHILDHASGKILSSFGRPGHQIGNFTHGHTIAVDSKGSIYVAETDWGRRIQKFKIVE